MQSPWKSSERRRDIVELYNLPFDFYTNLAILEFAGLVGFGHKSCFWVINL